jgi:hypothetical protein
MFLRRIPPEQLAIDDLGDAVAGVGPS